MTGKNKVEAVQQGEVVIVPTQCVIRRPCENKTNGHWCCVTHQLLFENNFGKDTHINDGKRHRLVWICHEHGPEQPG
jgi:hypothetical protein